MKRERHKQEILCKRCVECELGQGVAILGLVLGKLIKLFRFFVSGRSGRAWGGGVGVGVPGGMGVAEGVVVGKGAKSKNKVKRKVVRIMKR